MDNDCTGDRILHSNTSQVRCSIGVGARIVFQRLLSSNSFQFQPTHTRPARTMASNESSLVVRNATLDDLAVIAELNARLAKETENIDLPQEVVTKGVEAVLVDPSKGKHYLVELDGQVVVTLTITYEWSEWRNKCIWWIQDIYVRQEHRRKGYYKMLYAHVKDEALKNGAGGLRLAAYKTNENAMGVYRGMGMINNDVVFEQLFTPY